MDSADLSNMQYLEMTETLDSNKLQTLTAPNKNNYIKNNMGRDERKKKKQNKMKDRTGANYVHISLHQDLTY